MFYICSCLLFAAFLYLSGPNAIAQIPAVDSSVVLYTASPEQSIGIGVSSALLQNRDAGASLLKYYGLLFPLTIGYAYQGRAHTHEVEVTVASSAFLSPLLRSNQTRSEDYFGTARRNHVADFFILDLNYEFSGAVATAGNGSFQFDALASTGLHFFARMYYYGYRTESASFGAGHDEFAWDAAIPLNAGLAISTSLFGLESRVAARFSLLSITSRPSYFTGLSTNPSDSEIVSSTLGMSRFATFLSSQFASTDLTVTAHLSGSVDLRMRAGIAYYRIDGEHSASTFSGTLGAMLYLRI